MSMRRPEARAKHSFHLERSEFGWSPSVTATHRHSSLPWHDAPAASSWDLAGRPLAQCRNFGRRDLLSLTGQYAAHLAWLRFCAVTDAYFAPEDWIVESRRGEDCRLVRIRAPRDQQEEEDCVPLTLTLAFSSYLGITDLDVFTRTAAKPDAVYHEIRKKLSHENAASTSWLRRSACGAVMTPGADALGRLLREPAIYRYSDDRLFEVLEAFAAPGGHDQILMMGGPSASPLEAWSAASSIQPLAGNFDGDAGKVAEKILDFSQKQSIAIAVRRLDTFDQLSRQLLSILLSHHNGISLLLPAAADSLFARQEFIPLDDTRYFVVSPRLAPLTLVRSAVERIDASLRAAWINEWVESPAFDDFLDNGLVMIESAEWKIDEPARSYVAALALLGESIPEEAGSSFLTQLGCHLPLEAICTSSILGSSDGLIRFSSSECQRYFARQVPSASRLALYALAASTLDRAGSDRAADFYILAGDHERARELLEASAGSERPLQASLATLETVPELLIRSSPVLSGRMCRALISSGQYSRAESFASALEDRERDLLLALIHRRRGDYRAALSLLGNLDDEVPPSLAFDRILLMGELRRLTGERAGASSCFDRCRKLAGSASELERIAFESAMLMLDMGETPEEIAGHSFLALRLRAYRALLDSGYAAATSYARTALREAPDIPSAIDASLDLMNARFLSGQWDEARFSARESLALIEETEGDRASGGVLFLLGYLCADAGQWKQARGKIETLRSFYQRTGDNARLLEVNLIEAHLALCDGDAPGARRSAGLLLAEGVQRDIREAAALIIDDADWMEGKLNVLHSTGNSGCSELQEWHQIQRSRLSGKPPAGLQSAIWPVISRWELNPASPIQLLDEASQAAPDRLRALRSAAGILNRRDDPAIREWVARAAADLGCSSVRLPGAFREASPEMGLIHEIAGREFPFESAALAGHQWRFARRNRLGGWNQWGSLDALAPEELDDISANLSAGWQRAGERGLVFISSAESWPAASQEAVGSLMRLRADHHQLQTLLAEEERSSLADAPAAGGIVGESSAIRDVTQRISRLSKSEAVVCILGESGTGKELVARSIHRQSPRRGRSFTPINCAALPDALVESELFGHVRGAYTGADRDHAGLIESTDGGTLFLDEIGELPLSAQSKLLRFLQEGEYRRVGDNAVKRADVRIIAATNRELERAVDEGTFREDLFYRINVIEVRVPPLRERGSDIVLLARFFLAEERARQTSGAEKFTDEVELVLLSHNWPGNVRELQNAVKASFAMAGDSRRIGLEHLPSRLRGVQVRSASTGSYFEELNRFRKSLVEQSLLSADGNQNQAAKLLGISRQALAYQIRELGIPLPDSSARRRRV